MKSVLLGFALALFFVSGSAHALKLTDGLYFTVLPNSTAEVYFILPDDVGTGMGKADYFITTTAIPDWDRDLTQRTISTDINNTAIIPIRFFTIGKSEGECSNYTMTIQAPSLGLSRSWKGGICVSKYMDVDIVTGPVSGPKEALNQNVDLFSLGFRTASKAVKPGENFSLELLVQSQASLTIDVSVASDVQLAQKSFMLQTGKGSGASTLMLAGTAGAAGTYQISATAKARGCTLGSCTKQVTMTLDVSDSGPKSGYSVSIFPENLAIKSLAPVIYSFTIQNNYQAEASFVTRVEKPYDLDSSFVIDTFAIPALSEKTVNFTVTPRNQTGFYEIKVIVNANDMEKVASAYLSTNEMVSDVYRSADEVRSQASTAVKAEVDSKVKTWYSSYTKSEYGSNMTAYASLQKDLESEKGQSNQTEIPENETGEEPAPASPLGMIVIPVIIGVAVLFVLLFMRKRQGKEGDSLDSIKF